MVWKTITPDYFTIGAQPLTQVECPHCNAYVMISCPLNGEQCSHCNQELHLAISAMEFE